MRYNVEDLLKEIASGIGVAIHLRDGEIPILEARTSSRDLKPMTILHRFELPPLKIGETEKILRALLLPDEFEGALGTQFFVYQIVRSNVELDVLVIQEAGARRVEIRRPGFTHPA